MFDILYHDKHASGGRRLRPLAVSLALHAAVLGALVWAGRAAGALPFADAGAGDGIMLGNAGGGGGGGERITFLEIRSAPPTAPVPEMAPPVVPEPEQPVLKPPTPTPAPSRPDSVPMAPAAPAGPRVAVASGGGGSGGGEGTGTGEGTGPGIGPGSGGGSGVGSGGGIGSGVGPGSGEGRITPPETDLLLIPPPRPKSMGSRTIVFVLAVDTAGIVRDVELQPPTGDRKYDAALRRMALEWRFKPARDATNRPVAVKYPVTLTI